MKHKRDAGGRGEVSLIIGYVYEEVLFRLFYKSAYSTRIVKIVQCHQSGIKKPEEKA